MLKCMKTAYLVDNQELQSMKSPEHKKDIATLVQMEAKTTQSTSPKHVRYYRVTRLVRVRLQT